MNNDDEMVKRVTEYMARFDTVDAILARVRELGIKGFRLTSCNCVVARLLRQELGLRVRFNYGSVTINDEFHVELDGPNPFTELARGFDDRHYPDLIEMGGWRD